MCCVLCVWRRHWWPIKRIFVSHTSHFFSLFCFAQVFPSIWIQGPLVLAHQTCTYTKHDDCNVSRAHTRDDDERRTGETRRDTNFFLLFFFKECSFTSVHTSDGRACICLCLLATVSARIDFSFVAVEFGNEGLRKIYFSFCLSVLFLSKELKNEILVQTLAPATNQNESNYISLDQSGTR